MTHSDAVNLVMLELSIMRCMVARHFVGLVTTEGGGKRKIGTPGHADISGVTATGRAIAIEVKVGSDRPKPNQREWAAAWLSHGGLYAVIRPDRDGWKDDLRTLVQP